PGFLDCESIGVGPAPHGQQYMRSNDLLGLAYGAVDPRRYVLTTSCEAYALGPRSDCDALIGENSFDCAADIFVLPPQQMRTFFDHRHFAAKAPEHLREFESDVAAADNDE